MTSFSERDQRIRRPLIRAPGFPEPTFVGGNPRKMAPLDRSVRPKGARNYRRRLRARRDRLLTFFLRLFGREDLRFESDEDFAVGRPDAEEVAFAFVAEDVWACEVSVEGDGPRSGDRSATWLEGRSTKGLPAFSVGGPESQTTLCRLTSAATSYVPEFELRLGSVNFKSAEPDHDRRGSRASRGGSKTLPEGEEAERGGISYVFLALRQTGLKDAAAEGDLTV